MVALVVVVSVFALARGDFGFRSLMFVLISAVLVRLLICGFEFAADVWVLDLVFWVVLVFWFDIRSEF